MKNLISSIPGVSQEEWIKAVEELKQEHGIQIGTRRDETSARRLAILVGELYLTRFGRGLKGALFVVPAIEKDVYDLALELRLTCDPLEREDRVGRKSQSMVLCTWGVDRKSGAEDFTTILKGWTAIALAETENARKEDDHGTGGEIDPGERAYCTLRFEEIGIG
jgi:hypothetical protein